MVPFPELDLEPGFKHKVSMELEPKPRFMEKKELYGFSKFWIKFVFL
jgi:hypothetical protein